MGTLKLVGPELYPPQAWGGFLFWGLLNAIAVAVVHRIGRPRTAPAGGWARLVAWRGVTLAIVSVAWVPFCLPPWNTMRDCLGVLLRLTGLR